MRPWCMACRSLSGLLAGVLVLSSAGPLWAQGQRSDIELLKQELEELRRRDEENRRRIEELQRRLESIQAAPAPAPQPVTPEDALEKAIQELPPAPPAPGVPPELARPGLLSRQIGGTTFRLIDISLDILVAAGFSTETDESLQTLQGGGHDPSKRGFTLQQAELSLLGVVDPYFNAESHIVFFIDPLTGETGIELEEAFFTTQTLPYTLQLKGGFFLTEFGLINPTHPHAWDWLDQPVINTRLFGADGMRQAGLRLKGLLPLPWFSELYAGVQNADGETMASFYGGQIAHTHGHGEDDHDHGHDGFETGIAGRPIVQRDVKAMRDLVYTTRWVNAWDLSPQLTTQWGLSGAFGPNTTGRDGYTQIYGTDLLLRWRPLDHFRGWPFFAWQSEFMYRNFRAAAFAAGGNGANGHDHDHDHDHGHGEVLPAQTLHDWGFYTQLLYGFRYGWAGGLRYEYATGSGPSVGGRNRDPFRDNRHRLSPLLSWRPTEFSRIRLQYNYDRAEHLEFDGLGNRERDAHSLWLGFEVLIGAHPAHRLY